MLWDDRYKEEAGNIKTKQFFFILKKNKYIIYILNSQSFIDQTLNFFDIFSGSFLTTISIHLLAL